MSLFWTTAFLDFSDAEQDHALRGVNRNLESCEELRAMDIPLDTEPATERPGPRPGREAPLGVQ